MMSISSIDVVAGRVSQIGQTGWKVGKVGVSAALAI